MTGYNWSELAFINNSFNKIKWGLSHVQLFTAPWTVAHQAPLSMDFSRQEYWSGLPFPSPGDLPNPEIESSSCTTGRFVTLSHLGSPSNLLFMKWKHMSKDLSENVHSNFVENSLKMLSHFSRVWLFGTLWTVAHQAVLFMGFSKQEYWSGLPFPSPGDLPDTGMEPMSQVSCIARWVLYH